MADEGQETVFTEVFALLASTIRENSFRKYDTEDHKFKGGFLISAFEAVALGVAENLSQWKELGDQDQEQQLKDRVEALWENHEFLTGIGSGKRASQRIPVTVVKGRECIKP